MSDKRPKVTLDDLMMQTQAMVGTRFSQREDGAWVWGGKPREDPTRAGYPRTRQPLEWDPVSIKRCLERFVELEQKHLAEVARRQAKRFEYVREVEGKIVNDDGEVIYENRDDYIRWCATSEYEHSMRLVAEEYWARVANAIILGGE